MLRIGVLISGGGTNLQALIDNTTNKNIQGTIGLIISNKDSFGLERGKKAGIESIFIDPDEFASDEAYNKKLVEEFKKRDIDLIVLAGYLKILSKDFIRAYQDRIINIHPSLIPNFAGKNFYGDRVHKAVIEAGEKYSGATLHFVDEGIDTGPIILQEIVEVEAGESAASLGEKVLKAEHKVIVEGVKLYSEGKIKLVGKKVIINRSKSGKRALISVYDKDGLVNFARDLRVLGWDIISTGGSFKLLEEARIDAIRVEELTRFPEILDGRVKTLNPLIHGGILYKRDNEDHKKTLMKNGISSIDMVVTNLYPFEEMLKKNSPQEDMLENIDIGGPSMIRAAAKNYKDVLVVTEKKDYRDIIDYLKSEEEDENFRRRLAKKAFSYTAYYDSIISSYFNQLDGDRFPDRLNLTFKKEDDLRYGENPHQRAGFYREILEESGTISSAKKLHGKELSFNNINDANGALKILKEFHKASVVGVKHNNPCGIGSGRDVLQAFEKMYACDKESIFGGIIAANREIDLSTAKLIGEIFIEVVVAPSFSKDAMELLTKKKNIRLLQVDDIGRRDYKALDMKKTLGGLLVQESDSLVFEDYECVTKRQVSEEELEDLIFAFKAVKHVNSNGVVLVKDGATLAFGLGEVNRYWAVKAAIERSGQGALGSVMASDGFFPFKDSIEILGKAGVRAIIQPGGSIKDKEIIEEADKYDIAMVFTNMRHFKH